MQQGNLYFRNLCVLKFRDWSFSYRDSWLSRTDVDNKGMEIRKWSMYSTTQPMVILGQVSIVISDPTTGGLDYLTKILAVACAAETASVPLIVQSPAGALSAGTKLQVARPDGR